MNSARTGCCNMDTANRPNHLHFQSYTNREVSHTLHVALPSHAIKTPVPFAGGALGVPGSRVEVAHLTDSGKKSRPSFAKVAYAH